MQSLTAVAAGLAGGAAASCLLLAATVAATGSWFAVVLLVVGAALGAWTFSRVSRGKFEGSDAALAGVTGALVVLFVSPVALWLAQYALLKTLLG